MPCVLCYTKPGTGTYPDRNYPGHVAFNCDLEHAMHLAVSEDGARFTPLRSNTGVLFPRCTFDEGNPKGTTKTLIDPWLCRAADGSFRVLAVRRNQNAPDPRSIGCVMVFASRDLVRYEEIGFLRLAEGEIRRPRAVFDARENAYALEWETDAGHWRGWSDGLTAVRDVQPCAGPRLKAAENPGIDGCVPGNILEISAEEAAVLRGYLGEIRITGVEPPRLALPLGARLSAALPPRAVCRYSDGSTHEKRVAWDAAALAAVDTSRPGVYRIPGTIQQKRWPFPVPLRSGGGAVRGMSDPCVTAYRGRYYLTSSGGRDILLRAGETVEGAFTAGPVRIARVPLAPGQRTVDTWAAELHEIDGTLYLFTALCPDGDWTRVKACVLRCHGAPCDPGAWEAPRLCVKSDGSPLTEGGISLDMTWFRDHGRDYVMWSDRKIHDGVQPPLPEPADIFIATVDPAAPWRLTSDPHCVIRPMYGWDRCETEVDEGPYLLRHGEDLFVTVSGSSTGMGDLYDVGLLHAHSGADLLDAASWDWLPYPLLTKESVPGEYGPGHNNFVIDPESGDTLMIYHAIPHDREGRSLNRRPGIRRVHWAATGLPYLEMTAERDLPEALSRVTLTLTVAQNEADG